MRNYLLMSGAFALGGVLTLLGLGFAVLVAVVGAGAGDGSLLVIALVLFVCACVGCVIAWRGWQQARRRLRFIQQGEAVRGEIVARRLGRQTTGLVNGVVMQATDFVLLYRFTAKSGDVVEGRVRKVPSSIGRPYEHGDRVTVVYDPQNPAISDVDFFGERGWLGN